MKFTAALFAMVAFVGIIVGMLAVLGPTGALSIIYLLVTALFSTALINIIRGKTFDTKYNASPRPAKKWLFLTALLNVLGGVAAFIVYWTTKDHLTAIGH